ncbi:hybrid sensor histidine kinase/response regulator [Paraburkholderia strydomiana]|jgi:signal transduction histidine kinase/ActR/RegA family two-component response regulator|uniref:hybrid sensor histidine kinase/response regulator n=1 Tax=Paraburkholderia strydomiana TaxID=1245417 RepID=UPI00285440DA|nr:response regulator [Paraburkholderia strydomiana]MDR7009991.1 signal transduction histidine kinase/ActR/RegA family two-component response regulator [Paraburkholderia strydomiana]
MLRILLCVSIVLPVVFAVAYGYLDYQRRLDDANDIVDRLTLVVSEQADKVFDLDEQVGTRVTELLGTSDDDAIIANERQVHARLAAIVGGLPQIASVSVFGAHGKVLATSTTWPVPNVSVGDREDFRAARMQSPNTYFSPPMRSKIGNVDVFNTAFARLDANRRFIGVVSIALRRQYFADFYRQLADGRPYIGVGLYRSDGSPLVGHQPDDMPPRVPLGHGSTMSFVDGQIVGRTVMRFGPNDAERVVSFRKVAGYPVYVSSSYSSSAILQQWWAHYLVILAAISLPCLAVCALVVFSLRQLAAEQATWERWHGEVAMRISAEASSHRLRRISALTNLIGDIAHNVNNLLMVVASNMQLARHKHFAGVEREVTQVESAIATAEVLMRRLLSVARKRPLRRTVFNLRQLLSHAAGSIKSAAGETVETVLDVPDGVWPISIDQEELSSAIVAIAENAGEAMPAGGRFVVRCQNVRLGANEWSLSPGDYVMVSCVDNGAGMSADAVSRAFEPLFTTKTSGVGTGLGLAHVLATCEQVGGTARIDSIEGKGTNVRLYFPRHLGTASTAIDQRREHDEGGAQQRSVLLVEDNEAVAAGVTALLEMLGCDVNHKLSADDALTLLQEGRTFDVVLSDVQMPGKINGIDLAELVVQTWPNQRIALMTGYAKELDRARVLGITVLSKPFNIDDLTTLLSETEGRQKRGNSVAES